MTAITHLSYEALVDTALENRRLFADLVDQLEAAVEPAALANHLEAEWNINVSHGTAERALEILRRESQTASGPAAPTSSTGPPLARVRWLG